MGFGCQILLTNIKEGSYRSGQQIKGLLRYSIDKPTKFEFISVSFKGKGKCWWTESNGVSSDSSSFDTYSGKENYVFLHCKILQGTEVAIKTGVYELPFQFQLPLDLPSSFNDKICKIYYKIVAVFSKSGFFCVTKKIDTMIQICGHVKPCSPQPLTFGLTKCPFTAKKSVTMTIEIEKTLLTPGDDIILNCSIKNDTRVPITCIQTKLIAEITYTSDTKHKKMQRKTVDQTVRDTPEVGADSIANLICTVPTFPTLYSIQNSQIMRREYKVHVTVKFPFPHRDASVEAPIVLGENNLLGMEIVDELNFEEEYVLSSHDD